MSIALNKRDMNEMESKIIKISSKKQITIPQAYFEKIGFSEHAECILRDNELVVRPLRADADDYSDLILADLIQQGLSGEQLLSEFRNLKGKMRIAAQRMLDDAIAQAKADVRDPEKVHKEIFSDVD